MKGFQQFQQVTGGNAARGPGGGKGKNPYAAKPPQSPGPQRGHNRNRPKGHPAGGAGSAPAAPPGPTAAPPTGGTPVQDANKPGLIATLATEKPLDYFSGQLAAAGQLPGNGPATYENWLQNQFFNDEYAAYMAAKTASPYETSFDTYLATKYGPGGIGPAAQQRFNEATASQRGETFNPYASSGGRWQ